MLTNYNANLYFCKNHTPLVLQELPLYCSGGLRFFWDNKFDHAMVAFLDCVQQFKEEVEKGDTGFCLPYRLVFTNAITIVFSANTVKHTGFCCLHYSTYVYLELYLVKQLTAYF